MTTPTYLVSIPQHPPLPGKQRNSGYYASISPHSSHKTCLFVSWLDASNINKTKLSKERPEGRKKSKNLLASKAREKLQLSIKSQRLYIGFAGETLAGILTFFVLDTKRHKFTVQFKVFINEVFIVKQSFKSTKNELRKFGAFLFIQHIILLILMDDRSNSSRSTFTLCPRKRMEELRVPAFAPQVRTLEYAQTVHSLSET